MTTRLPQRYAVGWREPFETRAREFFSPGVSILDVGAGRKPSFPRSDRPQGCTYVGADILESELNLAKGGYDDAVSTDIRLFDTRLDRGFDIALSFQVLEHIKPLSAAVENIRRYLRPGGVFVSQLSGGLALYAVLNRMIPQPVSKELMHRLLGRPKDSVFPATYDKCTRKGLNETFAGWSQVSIESRWIGANYFRFAAPLQSAYLRVEDWAMQRGFENLAPYYVLTARR